MVRAWSSFGTEISQGAERSLKVCALPGENVLTELPQQKTDNEQSRRSKLKRELAYLSN